MSSVRLSFPTQNRPKMRVRRDIAELIKMHIRLRVGRDGRGASGRLKGYSTNPLVMTRGDKPRLTPKRGWHSFHGRGYKQYREELGLESDKFVFDNKGAAWRDWMGATQDDAGPLAFGFANSKNLMAADAATENDREDMFDLNAEELEIFAEAYLEHTLDLTWGR